MVRVLLLCAALVAPGALGCGGSSEQPETTTATADSGGEQADEPDGDGAPDPCADRDSEECRQALASPPLPRCADLPAPEPGAAQPECED